MFTPDAAVLVHPGISSSVIDLADVVGSTSQIIRASQEMPNEKFIVATDKGIFHKMRLLAPDKVFIEAPTAGSGATCRSCAHCPWMGSECPRKISKVRCSRVAMKS